jgi:dienelactone hydrolase
MRIILILFIISSIFSTASAESEIFTPTKSELITLPSGRRMYYEFFAGKPNMPTYVLLHGLTKNGHFFSHDSNIAQKLVAMGFSVMTPDLHGNTGGRTPLQYKRPISYEDNSIDVAALIQHLKLKKVVLAGHSYGGWIALSTASRVGPNLVAVYAASPYLQNREMPKYLDMLQASTNRQTRLAAEGLPDDVTKLTDQAKIPGDIPIFILLGDANSILPTSMRTKWKKCANLGKGSVNIDRSMITVYLRSFRDEKGKELRPLPKVLYFHGSHMWPEEYPEDFVNGITRHRN